MKAASRGSWQKAPGQAVTSGLRRSLSAYFNLSVSRAIGNRVITSQYNFAVDDLAYVVNHWIFLIPSGFTASAARAALQKLPQPCGRGFSPDIAHQPKRRG